MSTIKLTRSDYLQRLDEVIDSFEAAMLRSNNVDVGQFLPPPISRDDRRLGVELLCVDMQHRWDSSRRRRLDDYREQFHDLLSDPDLLGELACEEYRLRSLSGEPVAPEDYASKYQVATRGWERADVETATVSKATGIGELGAELVRLTDSILTFPKVGDRLGEFELIDELGRGAFGIVYLARQGTLDERLVAIKVSTYADVESSYLARLQHTNIVPIYSLHQYDDLHAICMPYLGRRTLQTLLDGATDQPITEASCLPLATQLAHGLQHAHQAGVVHRDLKPANILISDSDTAMLLDFNLSHDVIAGGRSCLMIGGTLPYLAPEHLIAVRDSKHVGPPSDIFSLGVILYQLLTTKLPFPHRHGQFDDVLSAMIADRQTAPPNATDLNRELSPGMAAIVSKMMAPDLQNRYRSMDEVCDDLQRHAEHRPLRHARNPSVAELARKWCHRHPRVSSASSVALLSFAVVAALVLVLIARGQRLQTQEAFAQYSKTRTMMPEVRALVSMPDEDDISHQAGIEKATMIASAYGLFRDNSWRDNPLYSALSTSQREELDASLQQIAMLLDRDDALPDNWEQSALGDLLRHVDQPNLPSSNAEQERRFLYVVQLLNDGQYETAIPVLESMRPAAPHDISLWLLLGNAYAMVGRLSDAERSFDVCTSMWPDSYFGYFQRGLVQLEEGRYAAADADFLTCLELRPEHVPSLINLGVSKLRQREFADAERYFTDALQQEAAPTRVYFLRSEARAGLDDKMGSQADLARGTSLTPTDTKSWIRRGLAKLATDESSALADFQEALKLNPSSPAALRNVAYVYGERLHDTDRSLEVMNQLISMHGRSQDLVARGVLYARQGKRPEAVADAKRVLDGNPSAKELLQVACLYSLTSAVQPQDVNSAIVYLDRAITQDPRWLAVAMNDPDLEAARATPEYRDIVWAAKKRIEREAQLRQALSEDE